MRQDDARSGAQQRARTRVIWLPQLLFVPVLPEPFLGGFDRRQSRFLDDDMDKLVIRRTGRLAKLGIWRTFPRIVAYVRQTGQAGYWFLAFADAGLFFELGPDSPFGPHPRRGAGAQRHAEARFA